MPCEYTLIFSHQIISQEDDKSVNLIYNRTAFVKDTYLCVKITTGVFDFLGF